MDILSALNEGSPRRGAARCKLQETLDEIPAGTPGLEDLVAAVADPTGYPAMKLTMTFSLLRVPVSAALIADHRASRCRCFR